MKNDPVKQSPVRLSYRKENKGYTIYVHNQANKSIVRQRWFKGKRKVMPGGLVTADLMVNPQTHFLPESRHYGYPFDGGGFHVRHAGYYSVCIIFADSTTATAIIRIRRFRHRYTPALLGVLIPTGVMAASIAGIPGLRNLLRDLLFGPSSPTHAVSSSKPASSTASGVDNRILSSVGSGTGTLNNLKTRQGQAAYSYVSIVTAQTGSTTGSWHLINKNTELAQKAVIYECSTESVDGKAQNTPIKAIGETSEVASGQASTQVTWYAPLSGQSRIVCAVIYTSLQGKVVNVGFAQNLNLVIK